MVVVGFTGEGRDGGGGDGGGEEGEVVGGGGLGILEAAVVVGM